MSDYVENDYVEEDYVEADEVPATVCDLTEVLGAIAALTTLINQQSVTIAQQNTMLLALNSKVLDLQAQIDEVQSSQITYEQYRSTVPSVDDVTINAYPLGTLVAFMNGTTTHGDGVVRGSRFIPKDSYNYELVYDVELENSNPVRVSSFPAGLVVRKEP